MLGANAVRLLIADDDPNVLAAYALFFDAHGYETRVAGDGADALVEWRAWRPDVVVLDIQMPHMDGHAVAREIRRLQSAVLPLLVAITGLSAPSDRAESMKSGFDYHFAKPANLPTVLATITSRVRPGAADGS
jgi:CheY-like chemotaxis protein